MILYISRPICFSIVVDAPRLGAIHSKLDHIDVSFASLGVRVRVPDSRAPRRVPAVWMNGVHADAKLAGRP